MLTDERMDGRIYSVALFFSDLAHIAASPARERAGRTCRLFHFLGGVGNRIAYRHL